MWGEFPAPSFNSWEAVINVVIYLQFSSFTFLIRFIQNKKVGDEILDLLNVPSHKVRIEDLKRSCPKSVLWGRSGNPAGFWHTYWQLSQTPHPLAVSTISHLDILQVKIKFQSTLFDSQIPPSAYLAAWPLLPGRGGGVRWQVHKVSDTFRTMGFMNLQSQRKVQKIILKNFGMVAKFL